MNDVLSQYESPESQPDEPLPPKKPNDEPEKLSIGAHFLCGWPLLLVAIGGAVGGGLGGVAYGINTKIYRSSLPIPVKIILNLVTGLGAIVLWFFIALAISGAIRG